MKGGDRGPRRRREDAGRSGLGRLSGRLRTGRARAGARARPDVQLGRLQLQRHGLHQLTPGHGSVEEPPEHVRVGEVDQLVAAAGHDRAERVQRESADLRRR